MELRHLRYFIAVAERNNVSQAARALRVAQPALSRQIRDLEAELGVTLLERNSRGVQVTEAGRAFAAAAREVLARAEAAIQSARAVARGEQGEVHLGYAPSPTAELLPQALQSFAVTTPGVRVVLHDCTSDEMLRGLLEETLHAALLVQPCAAELRGVVFEALKTYPMCVAVAPSHPLARSGKVSLKQLLGEKLVTYARSDYGDYHAMLKRLFVSEGRVPEIAEEIDSATSLIAAVEARRGVAVVPSVMSCLAGPRLKLRPLEPPPPPVVVGFAHRTGPLTPVVKRLVETMRGLKRE